jgi:hypothetical protein
VTPRRFRAFAFVAAAAVLMQLAWTFVGPLSVAASRTEQVICILHGAMTIPAPADETPKSPTNPVCALCAATGVALAGAAVALTAPAVAAERAEDLFAPSVARRAHHFPARPRAPPALS